MKASLSWRRRVASSVNCIPPKKPPEQQGCPEQKQRFIESLRRFFGGVRFFSGIQLVTQIRDRLMRPLTTRHWPALTLIVAMPHLQCALVPDLPALAPEEGGSTLFGPWKLTQSSKQVVEEVPLAIIKQPYLRIIKKLRWL
jgi:hypothetical protein